ncbi:acyltransferase [Methylobacterium sp. GC_Met_3]|uniref:acyltransferase family protein n=1 Tax=Methylobacterium sp. GC_Met_3 TaxID=2937375 RepID=UPI00226A4F1B|nr:acyltransferase [Methylobacterium sp. GC_Met_3]
MCLALVVVVQHFSRLSLGDAAVCLFFVLSGYWIYVMWEKQYSHTRNRYFTFLTSRFLRIVPTFLLCSAITFALYPRLIPTEFAAIASSLFVVGYRNLPQLPIVPAWSLDIELQFYILFPLLYLLFHKVDRRVAVGALICWSAISVAILYFRSGAVMTEPLPQILVLFMIGAAAARWRWVPPRAPTLASAGITVAMLGLGLSVPALRDMMLGGSNAGVNFVYNPVFNLVLALAAVPLALSTVHVKSGRLDRALGDLSYIVYLMHWPAFIFVHNNFGELPPLQRLPYALLALGVVFIVSVAVWMLWDRPINRARHAWVRGRMRLGPVNRGIEQPAA